MTDASYLFDLDPRYGWVHINTDRKSLTIIVQDGLGRSYGFEFTDGEMIPTCICGAREQSQCGCYNVDWSE